MSHHASVIVLVGDHLLSEIFLFCHLLVLLSVHPLVHLSVQSLVEVVLALSSWLSFWVCLSCADPFQHHCLEVQVLVVMKVEEQVVEKVLVAVVEMAEVEFHPPAYWMWKLVEKVLAQLERQWDVQPQALVQDKVVEKWVHLECMCQTALANQVDLVLEEALEDAGVKKDCWSKVWKLFQLVLIPLLTRKAPPSTRTGPTCEFLHDELPHV